MQIPFLIAEEMTRIVNHPRPERVYVKVNSDFDSTGYMQPKSIIWKDGRVFKIDEVKDFRPAAVYGRTGDCYTVVIQGEMKYLFFERSDPRFASKFGRWFVEAMPASS
jgi:hypothetical protein